MQNSFKKGRLALRLCLLFAALLAHPPLSGDLLAAPPAAATECTCDSPYNATVTGQTSSSFSFAWDATVSSTEFKIWYICREDNYTSQGVFTSNRSVTVANLPAGTYTFFIATVCDGSTSQPIILDDLML